MVPQQLLVPPDRRVEPAGAVGARGREPPRRDHVRGSAAEGLVGVLVQVDLHAFGPSGIDHQHILRRVAPAVGSLRLDVGAHDADPRRPADLDRLAHPVGPGQRLIVDDGGRLPEGERRLAPLVRVVEAVVLGDDPGQRDQLLGGAEPPGPVLGSRAQSPGAVLHPAPHQRRHLGNLGLGGVPLVVVAHDQTPHRAVAHHRDHVGGNPQRPVNRHLLGDRPSRVAPVRPEDRRGDPLHDQVVGAPGLDVVGGERPVGVGVHVDEAGDHMEPRGVDRPVGFGRVQLAHGDDLVPGDPHIREEGRPARSVQHQPAPNENVETLGGSRSRGQEGERKQGSQGSQRNPLRRSGQCTRRRPDSIARQGNKTLQGATVLSSAGDWPAGDRDWPAGDRQQATLRQARRTGRPPATHSPPPATHSAGRRQAAPASRSATSISSRTTGSASTSRRAARAATASAEPMRPKAQAAWARTRAAGSAMAAASAGTA